VPIAASAVFVGIAGVKPLIDAGELLGGRNLIQIEAA